MNSLRRGDENILCHGMPIGYHLNDFWRWSSSDLLNNTLRGVYGEFIVATALEIDTSVAREDWTPWDLAFPYPWTSESGSQDEIRIEVKTSAYLQSWTEDGHLSNISFSIRPTRAWSLLGGYSELVQRQSDVYVFCLYTENDPHRADPLILDGWEFYVISTKTLDEMCGKQKSISLNSLKRLDPIRVDYDGIAEAVVQCVQNCRCVPPPVA